MSKRRQQRGSYRGSVNFNPEINRGLIAIFLFVVAGLAALSFFSMAGVVGQFIDSLLALGFGQIRFVFPLILILIAILLIKDLEYSYRSTHTLGAILFFLSFNGLFHTIRNFNLPEALAPSALQGYDGGLVGLALSWPLAKYAGFWVGLLVLIAILIIAIIFLFNTSLAQIVDLHKKVFLTFGWAGREILAFFGSFKKTDKVKFSVNGEYEQATPVDRVSDTIDEETNPETDEEITEEEERIFQKKNLEADEEEPEPEVAEEKERIIISRPKYNYKLPPLELLHTSKSKPTAGDIKGNAETIRETFFNFGIEVDMGEVRVGPTVTQYSFKPARGVKLSRISALSNDLALALAAHPIRIEAPIPGQSLVGIEVPNQKVAMVTLKELLESQEFKERKHNMMIALGKDVAGKIWWADLPNMPHLLIAGSTGSGKTVCINTLILSLLFQNTPDTLRMIMVDPKRVELTLYNGLPHLLTPVITDPGKTVNALKWTIGEMERRFDLLAKNSNRDITTYNLAHAKEPMPQIVFIIDELAALMATTASEVEAGIIRIAQMARAVGIHLIVATQRPSVEVITGLMKANIPARIAFSVASLIDSRTILDCSGAEKLLGRGDMLLLTAELSKPKRIQGAFVSEEEMKEVVEFEKAQGGAPEYDETIVSKNGAGAGTLNMFGGPGDDSDPLFEEAKRVVVESGKASASLLQRRLKLGYARAARILDEMEEAGIVGPADGAKPREVFTEHLEPTPETEIPDEEQTMDLGGTILNEPTTEAVAEKTVEESGDKSEEEPTDLELENKS
ncbi:MAG: DNA translocase FtsK 4TM domain-containing protein [bacterium]|nr:DNA translocase FtsK 4TM domain-containing protein [bacterium]